MTASKYPARAVKLLYTLSALAFPPVVWLGVKHGRLQEVIIFLMVVFALRLGLLLRQKHPSPQLKKLSLVLAVVALAMFAASLTFRKLDLLLFYPVMVSTVMFIVFFSSLFARQSLVELIARLQIPNLNESGVAYTRRVTEIWCVFFVLNGCVAFYTCTRDSMEWWVWYNGLISYILMGLLMGIEYLYRRTVLESLKS